MILTDLVGVQIIQDCRVVVKFVRTDVFRQFLDRCEGCSFPMPDGARTGRVVNLSVTLIRAVRGEPFEMTDGLLTRLFGRFGKVLSMRCDKVSAGYCKGMLAATRTLACP